MSLLLLFAGGGGGTILSDSYAASGRLVATKTLVASSVIGKSAAIGATKTLVASSVRAGSVSIAATKTLIASSVKSSTATITATKTLIASSVKSSTATITATKTLIANSVKSSTATITATKTLIANSVRASSASLTATKTLIASSKKSATANFIFVANNQVLTNIKSVTEHLTSTSTVLASSVKAATAHIASSLIVTPGIKLSVTITGHSTQIANEIIAVSASISDSKTLIVSANKNITESISTSKTLSVLSNSKSVTEHLIAATSPIASSIILVSAHINEQGTIAVFNTSKAFNISLTTHVDKIASLAKNLDITFNANSSRIASSVKSVTASLSFTSVTFVLPNISFNDFKFFIEPAVHLTFDTYNEVDIDFHFEDTVSLIFGLYNPTDLRFFILDEFEFDHNYNQPIISNHFDASATIHSSATLHSSWSPYNLSSMITWLKADSLSLSNGDPVYNWNDLSGNNHFAYSSGTERPTFATNVLNSLPAVRLDGNTQKLLISDLATALSTIDAYTAIFLIRQSALGHYPIVLTWPIVGSWEWILEYDTSGGFYWGQQNGNYRLYSTAISNGEIDFLVLTKSSATSGKLHKNGTEITSYSNNNSGLIAAPSMSGDMLFGQYTSPGFGLQGDVHEVIICNTSISDANREKIEGYLAWKWGLVNLLPNSHPYKGSAP